MSTIRPVLAIAALLATFAISAPFAYAESFKRITTEAQYRELMVGKKIKIKGSKNWFKNKSNGTIIGNFGGKKYRANWAWRDGFLCRTNLTHGTDTDCQMQEMGDNKMRITRNRGRGEAFIVEFE